MDHKTYERANMPEISAASLNMKANYPAKKIESKPKPANQAIIKTCITCNKTFNQTIKASVLEKLPKLPDFDYQNKCLACIKEETKASKSPKYVRLKELRSDLDEITIVYQTIFNKWKAQAKEYQALDYQDNMIQHYEDLATKATKQPTKKLPKDVKTNTTLALKVLAGLSAEQQAAILTLLAKQAK